MDRSRKRNLDFDRDVKGLRERGYSYEQIKTLYSTRGVNVSVRTLKRIANKKNHKKVTQRGHNGDRPGSGI
jgi:intein-encoded DNA endonuclease-like protein